MLLARGKCLAYETTITKVYIAGIANAKAWAPPPKRLRHCEGIPLTEWSGFSNARAFCLRPARSQARRR
jgi:hypothetical protein